uniref:Beta-defensin n=1 Tax=Sus scrofa TaxID=9823 RepID=A0A8E8HT79_PIG|nr:beta defensin 133 [Sus scrofa]
MKISVLLFVLFFFLISLPPGNCGMKDTYSCFIKKGKCRRACHDLETPVSFCTKLNANCCMEKSEVKLSIPEKQNAGNIRKGNK